MTQRGVFEKQPGSGEWWIHYYDSLGRRHREKAGTKSAAILLYRKRKHEALEGKKLPEKLRRPSVSFAELAKDTLAYSKAHKRSYGDDAIRMERILGWFRNRAADSISPQEIDEKLTQSAEENSWAPATVNRYRALFSLTYSLGIRNGKTKENPARLVKHRTENNARIRFLSPEEEVRIRAAIEATCAEHLPEFEIALNTGLRLSELYTLTWDNVNLPRRILTVPRSKNGEIRHVPLNKPALEAFQLLRKQTGASGPIFLNWRDGRLTGPRYWFDPVVKKAKIRNFTWHCLRHTFASRLVMNGENLRTVQDLMGHKQISMTVRYSHLAPQHQLAAVERLAAASPVPRAADPTATRTATEQNEAPQQEVEIVN
ncbi:MAG TPA: site-specific integrase [Patescibacteria group bacterium]|nr:site-specific integrase [Patescibacteria group bacterium]